MKPRISLLSAKEEDDFEPINGENKMGNLLGVNKDEEHGHCNLLIEDSAGYNQPCSRYISFTDVYTLPTVLRVMPIPRSRKNLLFHAAPLMWSIGMAGWLHLCFRMVGWLHLKSMMPSLRYVSQLSGDQEPSPLLSSSLKQIDTTSKLRSMEHMLMPLLIVVSFWLEYPNLVSLTFLNLKPSSLCPCNQHH